MPPIKKRISLAVPISKVWAALTAPKAISAWMGGPVKSNPRVGGKFALFGGETTGRYTAVEKPNTLEYTWRQANWPATWPDSRVRWKLKATKAGTLLTLTHDKFPNQDERDSHDSGWDEYWLGPMQAWLEGQ
jgi:uncharacterized protein YndB with AHSA1/START domain